jgi:hypothetical protein
VPDDLLTSIASALAIPASALSTFSIKNFFVTFKRSNEEPEQSNLLNLVENMCQVNREKIELYERIAQEENCIIEILDRHLKTSLTDDREWN